MSATRFEIAEVRARRVWDSRARPTVEAEVRLASGIVARAIAPAGASRGEAEALERRDGGPRLGGLDVQAALRGVREEISPALAGRSCLDQAQLDRVLVELDGTPQRARLGGNALVAVSLANLRAAARASEQPLWRYLAGERPARIPLPQIQIFGGGAHAARRLDVQDFMVVPVAAHSFGEALEHVSEVYHAARRALEARGALAGVADEGGFWPDFADSEAALEALVRAIEDAGLRPGDDVAIALDVAASELVDGDGYRLDGAKLGRDALCARWLEWLQRYPIVSIEDPFDQRDRAGWRRFAAEAGGRVQIVGDDLLVSHAERVAAAADGGLCNALLLKPNQVGTVSEARAALDAARAAGFATIASARSGESEDATIAQLAVGWDAGQLKVGSPARGERTAKWNEVLRIEEDPRSGPFAGRAALAGTRES